MPKRRRRRKLNLGPILLLLLVSNLVAGIFYSKLTSLSKVRVVGAREHDLSRIEGILKSGQDQPALRLNPHELESRLQAASEVQAAEFSRNIFGRGLLRISYRTPVAKVEGGQGLGLSREGVLFNASSLPDHLPLVKVPTFARKPGASLAGVWPAATVGQLCDEIRDLASNEVLVVKVTGEGGLCLNMSSDRQVLLGQPRDLGKKLEVLKRLLSEDPLFLKPGATLNLVEPANPALSEANRTEDR